MAKRFIPLALQLLLLVTACAVPAMAGTVPPAAPELDPGSLAGAVAVMSGVFLLARDARRR